MKIQKLHISNTLHITTDIEGPHAVIFGGIHGDEPSGVHAIQKLVYDFTAGNLTLIRGTLTIAIGNEEALAQDKRYIHHNLNRIFSDHLPNDGSTYELRRAKELMPLLRNVDFFLDLHSIRSKTHSYAVCEWPNVEFARQLGIPNIAFGWAACCLAKATGDTDNYALEYGATSLTYEAGSHYEYNTIQNATATVYKFLEVIKMIEPSTSIAQSFSRVFRLEEVIIKEHESFQYTKVYQNFDQIIKGEIIAWQNKKPIIAPFDGYITLVNFPEQTRLGDDIFFLAREVNQESLSSTSVEDLPSKNR